MKEKLKNEKSPSINNVIKPVQTSKNPVLDQLKIPATRENEKNTIKNARNVPKAVSIYSKSRTQIICTPSVLS